MMAPEHRTAIVTAIAYAVVDVERMDEAVLVAALQELDHLIVRELTCQAVLHGPAAEVTRVKARLQHVVAVVAGIGEPV